MTVRPSWWPRRRGWRHACHCAWREEVCTGLAQGPACSGAQWASGKRERARRGGWEGAQWGGRGPRRDGGGPQHPWVPACSKGLCRRRQASGARAQVWMREPGRWAPPTPMSSGRLRRGPRNAGALPGPAWHPSGLGRRQGPGSSCLVTCCWARLRAAVTPAALPPPPAAPWGVPPPTRGSGGGGCSWATPAGPLGPVASLPRPQFPGG